MQADAIFEQVLSQARQTPGTGARKLAALLVRRRPAILALIKNLLAAQQRELTDAQDEWVHLNVRISHRSVELTDVQAKYLLTKHATGQAPAMVNRGKVMDRLMALGLLNDQAQVTKAGAEWCFENHLKAAGAAPQIPARPSTQRGGAAGASHIPRRAHTHHLILGDIEEDPPLGEPDNPHAYRSSQPTHDAVLPHAPRSPCTCGLPPEHPLHTAPPANIPSPPPPPLPGDHFRRLLPDVHRELVEAEQEFDQAEREDRENRDDRSTNTRPAYATIHVSYLKKLRAALEALARRADRDDIPAALRTTRTRSQLQVLLQTGPYNLNDEGRIAQGALMDLVNEQWNKEIEAAYWKKH